MTYQEAIDEITQWIVANGNNEITADVLRPVLLSIVEAAQDTTGDLVNLNTTDKTNLVAAINEVLASVSSPATNSVKLYQGTADPNSSPPTSHNLADFYLRSDINSNPLQLYQYNAVTSMWDAVAYGGGGGDEAYATKVEYLGVPITVPAGLTVNTIINLKNIDATVTYSILGTALTITAGAYSGDILYIDGSY